MSTAAPASAAPPETPAATPHPQADSKSTPKAAPKARAAAPAPDLKSYRRQIAARAVAALLGGYALGSATAACLGAALAALGMARLDAVMAATMLGYVLMAGAAIWAFSCASARRACWGIAAPALALLPLALWLTQGGQP